MLLAALNSALQLSPTYALLAFGIQWTFFLLCLGSALGHGIQWQAGLAATPWPRTWICSHVGDPVSGSEALYDASGRELCLRGIKNNQ